MRLILFLLAVVAFVGGGSIMTVAQSAVHEIEAFILFLVAAVFLSGAAIVEALNALRKKFDELAAIQGHPSQGKPTSG